MVLSDPGAVGDLRRRLMDHWLPKGAGPDFHDPDRALQAWWGLAARNAKAAPEARRGFILPYNLREAEAFGRAFPLVPDEMV